MSGSKAKAQRKKHKMTLSLTDRLTLSVHVIPNCNVMGNAAAMKNHGEFVAALFPDDQEQELLGLCQEYVCPKCETSNFVPVKKKPDCPKCSIAMVPVSNFGWKQENEKDMDFEIPEATLWAIEGHLQFLDNVKWTDDRGRARIGKLDSKTLPLFEKFCGK